MLTTFLALGLAAVVSAHDPGEKLTKPPLQNDLSNLYPGLNQYLNETSYTLSQWSPGYIPQECQYVITHYGLNYKSSDMLIYNVKYTDCGDPWVFCHHKNSNTTIQSMARQFGKMPIQMREWVKHVVDVPADNGWAYEYNGTITFVRPVDDMLNAVIHETGHSLDLNWAFVDKPLSSSDAWWGNYSADSNVPDPYAQSNSYENVAQNVVVATFNENVPGGFGSVQSNWGAIFHQYATIITEARAAGTNGNSIIKPGEGGATCKHRLQNSPAIPVQAGSKRFAFGPAPDVSIKTPGVTVHKARGGSQPENCKMSW